MAYLDSGDMNDDWNELSTTRDKETSSSQSSMSFSHTIPSHHGLLSMTDHSTANSTHTPTTTRHSNKSNPASHTQPPRTLRTKQPSRSLSTSSDSAETDELHSSGKPEQQEESKSPTASPLGVIYDNKTFSKFDQTYKYSKGTPPKKGSKGKTSKKKPALSAVRSFSMPRIMKITNFKNLRLCFKETVVGSQDDMKRCLNEYKSLRRFYAAYYAATLSQSDMEKMTRLFINRPKSSTKYPKKVRLVMRYYDGEDLDDFLVDEDDGEVGFLYENDFRTIMKKILLQLHICHEQGVLHCDLKPNNIRINEQSDKYDEDHPEYYDVNLIDFGFSHVFKEKAAKKKEVKLSYIKGTPGFIAPEIIQNKKYSEKSDIFALGCVAFFLLTNNYAVTQSPDMEPEQMMPDRNRLRMLIKRENERNRDDDSRIQQKTIDFVLSCLWRNPAKRPTAKEALKNAIFK